ncbi:MAG: Arc family DNA-binding protein [Brachymonas sp.]|nr:Arc family DNA-binding protein [Brachymonas sp.]
MIEDRVTVTLRIPVALRDWLHQQAKADRRSAHSLILRILEKELEKQKEKAYEPA